MVATGAQIKFDFFKNAVPNFDSIYDNQPDSAVALELKAANTFSFMVIYHCLLEIDLSSLKKTIRSLVSKRILSTKSKNLNQWAYEFLRYLFCTCNSQNASGTLNASKDEFDNVRTAMMADVVRRHSN